MAHCCKYAKRKEETFDFVSNSNQHVCKGKKVNHQLRLVPETVTITIVTYQIRPRMNDNEHKVTLLNEQTEPSNSRLLHVLRHPNFNLKTYFCNSSSQSFEIVIK